MGSNGELAQNLFIANNLVRPRIDFSTPKSFYCSPKSYHYIPFAQRRSQSLDAKRSVAQNRPRSRLSDQGDSSSVKKVASKLEWTTFAGCYPTDQFKVDCFNNCQTPLRTHHRKKCSATVVNGAHQHDNYEVKEELDQFKDNVLSDIIRRGVYTDSVVFDCISTNIARNRTLTMTLLQQAIAELLIDIGVPNSETTTSILLKKKTSTANVPDGITLHCSSPMLSNKFEAINEMFAYDDRDFESDEGESVSSEKGISMEFTKPDDSKTETISKSLAAFSISSESDNF